MSSRPPKVVFYSNIPSPYMAERLNLLARRGNLSIEAWWAARRTPDRSWVVDEGSWEFPARYLTLGDSPQSAPWPDAEMRAVRPDVLVGFYGGWRFGAGILAARGWARRVAVQAMVTYDTWVRRTVAKEVAKHLLFRSIDTVQIPGPQTREMVARYGLPEDRAIVVTESIEVAHYARARDLPAEEREARRRRLGLTGCVFLYVGRLIREKGVDNLLDAYRSVAAQQPGRVSLLVAGDGPAEQAVRDLAHRDPTVVSVGFVQRDALPEVYGVADVFVFPTLGDPYGYVVEEAMAAGLPVISSEAAGDIRLRVPEGQAGFVVPAGDSEALAARMLLLAQDPGLRQRLGEEAARLASSRDHLRYAQEFEAFVEQTLTMPARRNPAASVSSAVGQLATLTRRKPAPYGRELS